MIFQRISYRIAAQFTAFVFLLLLITGGIFLSVDLVNRDRMIQGRLQRQLFPLISRTEALGTLPPLPRFQQDRIRIVDASGEDLFSGTFFEDIPFAVSDDLTTVTLDDETYDVLTAPVMQNGQLAGYIQVADRAPPNDLMFHILIYFLISVGISGLTFIVGLFFARRSLKPAEQMMERLEQFTQDAGHELRTPLTSVSTSLDLAVATGDYPDNVRAAKKGLKEVSTLVERLLELARLDKFLLEKEMTDFSELLDASVSLHQPIAQEKHVTITSKIASDVFVECDPTLIKQVVSNLLTNAIKFNKPDGHITVTLTPASLTVQDTGKGISSDALAHIFDRFYQEDPSRVNGNKEGLGLGLALVKRIIDLHGWRIEVESSPGKGTTSTVYFS